MFKKLILKIILILCLNSCVILPEVIYYSYDIDDLLYKESITDLNTAWQWVSGNITYAPDKLNWWQFDDWQSAEETLIKRTGDCEDFAILLGEFLKCLNYVTELVVIRENTGFHAILRVNNVCIEPQAFRNYYKNEEINIIIIYSYDDYRAFSLHSLTRGGVYE
jgi:hypothetical protein